MQDLIDFIRSYREPVAISEAASELHALLKQETDNYSSAKEDAKRWQRKQKTN